MVQGIRQYTCFFAVETSIIHCWPTIPSGPHHIHETWHQQILNSDEPLLLGAGITVATNVDSHAIFGTRWDNRLMGITYSAHTSAPTNIMLPSDLPVPGGNPTAEWFDALYLVLAYPDQAGILRAYSGRLPVGTTDDFHPAGAADARLSYGPVRGLTTCASFPAADGTPRLVIADVDASTNRVVWAAWDGNQWTSH
jgi:hypothetical protein